MIERYKIIQKLGTGRAGSVYEALDKMLERKVALRRFNVSAKLKPEDYADKFFHLIGELSRINHAGVLSIMDAGIDNVDGPYVVSPLFQGKKVSDLLTEAPRGISIIHAHQLLRQLLSTLNDVMAQGFYLYAMSANSIIAQAKPTGGYHHMITDLGHSQIISLLEGKTTKHSHSLDPALIAPELYEGKPHGSVSTIYLLGHLSYWLLAGDHPFSKLDIPTAYAKHKVGEFPPLSGYRSDLQDDFLQWHRRFIMTNPADRYQSLEQALSLIPPTPKRLHSPRTARPPVKMRRE